MRLIGLDPGLRNTGWGIIDFIENKITWIASGTISPKINVTLPERLRTIHEEVSIILEKYNPNSGAIEEIFVNKNPQATLKLGMARGVCILVAEIYKIEIVELAPIISSTISLTRFSLGIVSLISTLLSFKLATLSIRIPDTVLEFII